MNPVILFRESFGSNDNSDELNICRKYFDVETQRNAIPENSFVFGRYSVLPYYQELEKDLILKNSCLVNSFKEHRYIADFEYYRDFERLGENLMFTPKSWFDSADLPDDKQFVVKGRTNSRRNQWSTHMFAPDKRSAVNIGCELLHDQMIYEQGLVYREFVPLDVIEYSVSGMPMSYEWRFFFYRDFMLCGDFYWTSISKSDIPNNKEYFEQAKLCAFAAAYVIHGMTKFYVIDVARTADGRYIVIEMNDAQMSGLSYNEPDELYKNLRKAWDFYIENPDYYIMDGK